MSDEKEKSFVSAVVYFRDAEGRVAPFLEALSAQLDETFESFEIICVDDASTDGTRAAIQAAADAGIRAVSYVNMGGPHGLEPSMKAGIDLSIGDFVFEFDYPIPPAPGMVAALYRKATDGFDIVGATPQGNTPFSSRLFYRLFNHYSHTQAPLQTEFARIVSRRAINRCESNTAVSLYRKAAYADCGLPYAALSFPATGADASAAGGFSDERRAKALDAFILFSDVGYRFTSVLAGIMMILAVATGIYSIILYAQGVPVEGWTTTILLISLCFLATFVMLSIVMKYLSLLLHLVFVRKEYSVAEIGKLS